MVRLLIDANLSPRVATGLNSLGFDAVHVADNLPAVEDGLKSGALVSIARGRLRLRPLPIRPVN